MIDPVSRWYTAEQLGPALQTWASVWEGEIASSPSDDNAASSSDHDDQTSSTTTATREDQQQPGAEDQQQHAPASPNKSPGTGPQQQQKSRSKGKKKSSSSSLVEEMLLNDRQMSNFHPVRRSRTLGPNITSTYGYNSYEKTVMIHKEKNCYPWIEPGFKYDMSITGLDLEIEHFFKYIKPTECERSARMFLFQTLHAIFKTNFPNIIVDTYGSFKTELFLPTSDIDIVIFSDWKKPPLPAIKKILIRSGICVRESVLILDKAVVPILKFRSVPYDLRVDITFNTSDAAKASQYIKLAVQTQAPIKPLVMTIKQFLLQRDANEVYHGGISSYALILMVIAFLKNLSYYRRCEKFSIGRFLILFFDFYGIKFDYVNDAISLNSPMGVVPKTQIKSLSADVSNLSPNLCIEDPLNEYNDVGKSSFGLLRIKSYFETAYWTLIRAINPESRKCNFYSITVLGRIILIPPEVTRFREFIRSSYMQTNYLSSNNIYFVPQYVNKRQFHNSYLIQQKVNDSANSHSEPGSLFDDGGKDELEDQQLKQ